VIVVILALALYPQFGLKRSESSAKASVAAVASQSTQVADAAAPSTSTRGTP
jgi:hypothetical protein